jgi:redox-sensitive bicupin YhaK (pirin superfamily)
MVVFSFKSESSRKGVRPVIALRKAEQRFHTKIDWLDSWHTFSFGEHYDPRQLGFRALRVINEDRVKPGLGFGTHGHRDMEILSYVVEGALQHRDSMGTGSVIRPGDLQRMSAGTGVMHSENNPSPNEPVHFLQIWIAPEAQGLPPSYEQRTFPLEDRRGGLKLVASRNPRDQAIKLHQDVDLYASVLKPGETVEHALRQGRHAWVQVIRGQVRCNDVALRAGDGAALSDEARVQLSAVDETELILFDLA